MKYLCLVYSDENDLKAMSESDFEAFSDAHIAVDEELKESGHSLVAEALQPVHTAKTVRVRGGKLSTTDGPFAETKEQLGGIYLIEASDLDEAIQVAAKIPSARVGCIEVRPVWELRQHAPRAWRR
ncbi:MAG: YciI family protein [Gammaproteobacteria bacterium]